MIQSRLHDPVSSGQGLVSRRTNRCMFSGVNCPSGFYQQLKWKHFQKFWGIFLRLEVFSPVFLVFFLIIKIKITIFLQFKNYFMIFYCLIVLPPPPPRLFVQVLDHDQYGLRKFHYFNSIQMQFGGGGGELSHQTRRRLMYKTTWRTKSCGLLWT